MPFFKLSTEWNNEKGQQGKNVLFCVLSVEINADFQMKIVRN